MFDVGACLDELGCRSTGWLVARRDALVVEQRRLRVEELAVMRVLESLPEVAAAAYAGGLSGEQLVSVARLADGVSDGEWAVRAPRIAPADLARLVRTQRAPTVEEGRARREARTLRMWWERDRGVLGFCGELPDIDGARFEAMIDRMVDGMRPAKGEAWDTREHRGADALVELCERFGDVESPTVCLRPLLVVEVPMEGPAEVVGIPLPDAMVESLRAQAAVEPVLVDDGVVVAHGARSTTVSLKIARAVRLRDGHCRWPGCERRTGLQVHHLEPRSWGGSDEIANLAMVCTGGGTDHHARLVPHGPWILRGNPNRPDGLELVRHRPRVRPTAA